MSNRNNIAANALIVLVALGLAIGGCAGGPITTREAGAGIGALGGAAAGGLVGSAVGHPAAGASLVVVWGSAPEH